MLKPRSAFVFVWSIHIIHMAVNTQQESNTIDCPQGNFQLKKKLNFLLASSKFQNLAWETIHYLFFVALVEIFDWEIFHTNWMKNSRKFGLGPNINPKPAPPPPNTGTTQLKPFNKSKLSKTESEYGFPFKHQGNGEVLKTWHQGVKGVKEFNIRKR